MSDKVKLTNEQTNAIENALEHCSRWEIVEYYSRRDGAFIKNFGTLFELDLHTLCLALYRPENITIEQKSGEQLFELYEEAYSHAKTSHETSDWWAGRMDGISTVLDIIGVKVTGINE